jgi:hypothetical protein
MEKRRFCIIQVSRHYKRWSDQTHFSRQVVDGLDQALALVFDTHAEFLGEFLPESAKGPLFGQVMLLGRQSLPASLDEKGGAVQPGCGRLVQVPPFRADQRDQCRTNGDIFQTIVISPLMAESTSMPHLTSCERSRAVTVIYWESLSRRMQFSVLKYSSWLAMELSIVVARYSRQTHAARRYPVDAGRILSCRQRQASPAKRWANSQTTQSGKAPIQRLCTSTAHWSFR